MRTAVLVLLMGANRVFLFVRAANWPIHAGAQPPTMPPMRPWREKLTSPPPDPSPPI